MKLDVLTKEEKIERDFYRLKAKDWHIPEDVAQELVECAIEKVGEMLAAQLERICHEVDVT